MARKTKPEPIGEPSTEEPDPTIAEMWDAHEPGTRVSKGVYSIYKTEDGGMHISYRAEDADEDGHLPVPAMMLQMMFAATEGKGPLGRMKAFVMGRFGG